MNIGVHVSFSVMTSSVCMPSNGIVGSYDSFNPSFFFFYGISILFSILAVSIYFPTNNARSFPFLPLLKHLLFVEFVMMAILTGVR